MARKATSKDTLPPHHVAPGAAATAHKVRLTMAQALVRFLCAQRVEIDGWDAPLFAGMWAIFGHGNVAGMGEALEDIGAALPVYRAHNEQAMAHAAVAYAKATRRQRMMACTTSVGPGATNMVTAAALAHANRLPVLLLPGDTFANRLPDPVLQQIEDFSNPTVTANDCFRPVCRYWDRIARPEQLLQSLPQAISVLTDPADCGPVTLALPQDVQAQAYDFPHWFFERRVHRAKRAGADHNDLRAVLAAIAASERPIIIAGGGVHYSGAAETLADFAKRWRIPVAETQAGKGALPWNHPCNVGAIGVTGSTVANELVPNADLVIAIGTRLQDFTTGSGLLLDATAARLESRLVSINVARHDVTKRSALALQGDAKRCLEEIDAALDGTAIAKSWIKSAAAGREQWLSTVEKCTAPPLTSSTSPKLPSDAQVLGVINRVFMDNATMVCAAGGLPGELHKLWRAAEPLSYHVEYGYSCMGYEIAGGVGVKLATPERDVVVLVGDGSYLMLNSEIATSVALGLKLTIVVLDNRGYGCINRLQTSLGGRGFNNLWDSSYTTYARPAHGRTDEDAAATSGTPPDIDFAKHAAALGALAEKVPSLAVLEAALKRAKKADRTTVIVIDTDPVASTSAGGAWWDVPVAEVSDSADVRAVSADYQDQQKNR